MKIKMILPALTEAKGPYWRPIKYSLFPPLGLATLAGYFDKNDDVEIQDEHVEKVNFNDSPDLVVIQVYITNAYRAYEIADHYRDRGIYVVMGGLHVTALPDEVKSHANSIFIGPGEDIWPEFIQDFKNNNPKQIYISKKRSLTGIPDVRRDLIKKELYLVPNSIVVSRGCPHSCDFCYKESFFKGGKSFYHQSVEKSLKEIEKLPGRHLFFLDDHLFGNKKFATALFDGMKGMNRVWQAAGTIASVLDNELLNKAVDSGLKSLFIGFETLSKQNLKDQNKYHNLNKNYMEAIKRLHDNGVMINGSFVYGLDYDNKDVFKKTTDWAVENGIETATFHILTPYPGTKLYNKMLDEGRIESFDWNLYDTRHAVYKPKLISKETLEKGYWDSYKNFYKWSSIFKGASVKNTTVGKLKHLVYSGGWKKFEAVWAPIIKLKLVNKMMPLLEKILAGSTKHRLQRKTVKKELQLIKDEI